MKLEEIFILSNCNKNIECWKETKCSIWCKGDVCPECSKNYSEEEKKRYKERNSNDFNRDFRNKEACSLFNKKYPEYSIDLTNKIISLYIKDKRLIYNDFISDCIKFDEENIKLLNKNNINRDLIKDFLTLQKLIKGF
ncbi:hypothetical protein [Spiroplasma citri]|uniref:hypothetical protein n=1 Tax=Spiroplasma citri TaxID=2133 RepID=UPI0011BB7D74|nr:hypothetical protein [Spiroplasma citri]QED25176.1 hypothetical protein FRX96_07355 [Spiroplasma citri]